MKKELCFTIENVNIYLEQVLVSYLDIPIFFLCSGKGHYYLALCADIDALNYIVVKLSIKDVYRLLHGQVPMRDLVLKQKYFWNVNSGEEINSDVVIKKPIELIDTASLPNSGACFKAFGTQMNSYIDNFGLKVFVYLQLVMYL